MSDRKPRIDGVEEAMRIASGANRHIKSPIDLCRVGQRFFDEIIDERPKADWTPHDISLAAILARTMADITEDAVQTGITQKLNAVVSMRRTLGLHAPAKADARELAKRRDIGKRIEAGITSVDDDDLLAKPYN